MLKKIGMVLGILFILFVVWFAWMIYSDKPPQFFPINQISAEYQVIDVKQKLTTSNSSRSIIMIKYTGPGIFKGLGESAKTTTVIVGKTSYNLNELVGKKIIITKGEFVSSNQQYISNTCVDLHGNNVVVNIDQMNIL